MVTIIILVVIDSWKSQIKGMSLYKSVKKISRRDM